MKLHPRSHEPVGVFTRILTVGDQERHKFYHDEIINAAEGGSSLAAGTLISIAGFKFHHSPDPFVELHNGSQFLREFGAGAVVFTPAASAGIIDTPAEAIYGSYRTRRDFRQNASAERVLSARREALEKMQNALQ